jgi:hypothetical protein
MARNSTATLTIRINGAEVPKSINAVNKEVKSLEKQIKKINQLEDPLKFKELTKEYKNLSGTLKEMKTEMTGIPTLFEKLSSASAGVLSVLGIGLTIGAAIGKVGEMFQKIKEFDSAMAELAGVTGTAKEELGEMSRYFIDLGKTNQYKE